jgi:hypothetical protein
MNCIDPEFKDALAQFLLLFCAALAVFAGVERRVSMVCAEGAEDGMLVSVPWTAGGHTVYVAVGNLFAYLCFAATLILALAAARTRG